MDKKIILAQELARTISQFWRVGRRKGTYKGIKQSEFMLLVTLIHSTTAETKGIKVSDLSTKLGITSAGVTHMINSLEDAGYVERLTDRADRRVVLVKATDKGEELCQQANEEHNQKLQGLVEFLGERDSQELIRLLSLTFNYSQESWQQIEGKSNTNQPSPKE